MQKKEEKTNVMRILDAKKIKYVTHSYVDTPSTNGVEVANILGQDKADVFKTLVTVAKSKVNYIFVVPVEKELDLKKAAAIVGEKNIEMIKSKDLLPLTGYIHGACSPIGMKKFFKTIIDKSAKDRNKIIFSAGKIGYQIETNLLELSKVIKFELEDIVVDK